MTIHKILFLFTSIVLLQTGQILFAAEAKDDSKDFLKVSGKASLQTNHVEKGLTQTNRDPGLQGSYILNLGQQFKMIIMGSNVSYEGSESHLLLNLKGELTVDFSPNFKTKISYSDNHYYKPENRNGTTLGVQFLIFDYRVLYEYESNWEGTETGASYYSFGKEIKVFGDWIWDNEIGYNMLKDSSYQNYFDVRSMLGYKVQSIFYQLGATTTSSPSQFNGAGDLFFIASVTAEF